MPAASEAILEFWFGKPPASETEARACMKRWFRADPRADALIAKRFGPAVAAAARSELDDWAATPRGRLALIVLLDQFPRNIYRGTPAAFAQDSAALELTTTGVGAGMDRALSELERMFFYMPMQHAESLDVQQRSVELFEQLARSPSEPYLEDALEGSAAYARQHRDIIAEFGRFPHRNAVLGRETTASEARYLERGGATFGQ